MGKSLPRANMNRANFILNQIINLTRSQFHLLLDYIRDDYTTPYNCPKPPFPTLVLRTARYRSASFGIFLTKNEWKISKYKNRHKGQRVFILGNGL